MSEKTFYPELQPEGKIQAIALMEKFKSQMRINANDILMDLYCDILPHIETDAWSNFKNQILYELCDYKNSEKYKQDYKQLRQAIWNEHKEMIIKDLNQDLVNQVKDLKQTLEKVRTGIF